MSSDSANLSDAEAIRDDVAAVAETLPVRAGRAERAQRDARHAPGGQWVRLPSGIELWSTARVDRRELTLREFCALHGVRLTVGV